MRADIKRERESTCACCVLDVNHAVATRMFFCVFLGGMGGGGRGSRGIAWQALWHPPGKGKKARSSTRAGGWMTGGNQNHSETDGKQLLAKSTIMYGSFSKLLTSVWYERVAAYHRG